MSGKVIWLSLIFLFRAPFALEALAQAHEGSDANTTNIRFESVGERVSIFYDLAGSSDDEYQVTIALRRESDPSFRHGIAGVSGDIGAGVIAGMNKRVLWDMSEEFPEGLPGDDYYFVVNADPMSSGSSALLWVGAGVAAVGGVATYFLLRSSGHTSTTAIAPSGFPAPPGRP